MNKIPELQMIDTLGGDFMVAVEVFEEPAEQTICITVDEGVAFHSANLSVECAKALRDWLNQVLSDESI